MKAAPSQLSRVQRDLFMEQVVTQSGSSLHIGMYLRLQGVVDPELLRRALHVVAEQNDALRFVLHPGAELPATSILPTPAVHFRMEEVRSEAAALAAMRSDFAMPFSLYEAPLCRFALFRCPGQVAFFYCAFHHLAFDGQSMLVLLQRVCDVYTKTQESLPTLAHHSSSQWFVEIESAYYLSCDYASDAEFWRSRFATLPAQLPARAVDAAISSPAPVAKTVRCEIDREVLAALAARANQAGGTTFHALLACVYLVVAKLTGLRDIAIGAAMLNRESPALEQALGSFAQFVPIRIDCGMPRSFDELLRNVASEWWEAWEHRRHPASELGRSVGLLGAGRRHLFDITLSYLRDEGAALRRMGVATAAAPVLLSHEEARFPLEITVSDLDPQAAVRIDLTCSTEYFDDLEIAALPARFERVLQSLARDPTIALDRLTLLTPDEHEQILVRWNDTARAGTEEWCVHELISAQARRTPQATAILCGEQRLSYAELEERSNQLARALRVRGVEPERIVGLCMDRSIELVVGMLAILKAGGAYLPLDPNYPSSRIDFMLRHSRACGLMTDSALSAVVQSFDGFVMRTGESGEAFSTPTEHAIDAGVSADHLAYVMYTSGSTGQPNGVMVRHGALSNFLFGMLEHVRLEPDEVIGALTSVTFDISGLEIYLPLISGKTLAMLPRATSLGSGALLTALENAGVTLLQGTPSTWRLLVEADSLPDRLRILCGGEALPSDLAQTLSSMSEGAWNLYGPTETTIWSTLAPLQAGAIPSIGRPIANTQIYLLDDELNGVPVGAVGEICIGGAGLARGYLGNPSLTATRFLANPFGVDGARLYRTGDRARYGSDGQLHFIGRRDDQVKIRGHRIELREVESALNGLPGVLQAAVVSQARRPGDHVLVAYLVMSAGSVAAVDALVALLRQRLPEYMIPSSFVPLESMPLNANGKVDRRKLPAPELAGLHASVEPETALEKQIAQLWADVLHVPRVGATDNFFELGGHSLLAVRTFARIRQRYGIDLRLADLFDAPRLREFCALVSPRLTSATPAIAARIGARARPALLPLSFLQEQLWFLEQLDPQGAAYALPLAYRLTGALDIGALERALAALVQRHESLRTRFEVRAGEPFQVIEAERHYPLEVQQTMPFEIRETQPGQLTLVWDPHRARLDLLRGPLIRVFLCRRAPEDHVLILVMHHILWDGWSMDVLRRELAILYRAFVSHESVSLPELPVQYADFALWQREQMQGEEWHRLLEYWKTQLANLPLRLNLPTDHPRPSVRSGHGATVSLALPEGVLAALSRFGREEGASLFMVLMAAFQLLLSRLSGQQDIVVGSPFAGRTHAETQGVVGFFANTVALRARIDGAASFRTLLALVKNTVLEAHAHHELPFERLVAELHPERDLSSQPLFQVMFVLHQSSLDALALSGLEMRALDVVHETRKFDLSLSIDADAAVPRAAFEYATELFEEATIARFGESFLVLLRAIIADPERRVSELPLLSALETQRLLVDWNATDAAYPNALCIHDLFVQQAVKTPTAIALVHEDRSLSYRDLNERSAALAGELRRLGVGADVVVGLHCERSVDLVVALLAILRAGGACLPMDPDLPPGRLDFMIADAGVGLILTQSDSVSRFEQSGVRVMAIDASVRAPAGLPATRVDPENLAYLIYTSGSTGTPKAVALPHRVLVNLVSWHLRHHASAAETRTLQLTPISFDVAQQEIFATLVAGKCLVLIDGHTRRDPRALAEFLRMHEVHDVFAPNVLLEGLARAVENSGETRLSLRNFFQAGESLVVSSAVRSLFAGHPTARLHNHYGPSETHVATAYRLPPDLTDSPVPIGRPIANTRLYVLDEALEPVPQGVCGELYIGGDVLARGYLNRPALTAERFIADPFGQGTRLYRTGDRARHRYDGELEYLGRLDQQVKLRGNRVELGEVEAVLRTAPGVEQAVALVVPDLSGELQLIAYVVGDSASSDALRQHLSDRLPHYMVPNTVVRLDAFPVTATGKIDLAALRAPPARERLAEPDTYVKPRTALESEIAVIWSELLGVERIGVHDDFFEQGGHSLLATRAMGRIGELLDTQLSLRLLFEAPTIDELAPLILAQLVQDPAH
jgi:amino acid adenylation domain-containing protein